MNFWESMWAPLRNWFGGRQSSGTQITGPASTAADATAVAVTEETALQLSAVWACIRLISQTVASLPMLVYRREGDGRVLVEDHWFIKLMRRPNLYQTRFEFWEHQVANLALHGNFYNVKSVAGGAVVGLMPMNPLQTETRMLVDGSVVHLFSHDGNIDAVDASRVWHAKLNGDLIVGRSPLQFGRNIFGVAQASELAVTNIYRNGGKPSGVLSFDRLLTPDQRAAIRTNFADLTTGTDERLLVLEAGAKFEAVSMSPQDIELLQSRRFQLEEICRWFGVPSVLVNDTSGSTTWGSGIEQLVMGFYKLNLRPYLEAIENSIVTHLFSKEEQATHDVEFDFEALLRSDMRSRYEGYRVGINAGVLMPNEARAREWLPPVEGGSRLLIQGAMVPIEDVGKVPAQGEISGNQATAD